MASRPPVPRLRRTGWAMLAVALAMLGLGYAAVPLYRLFCQATGYGGTPARISEAGAGAVKATSHPISIRFDANIEPTLGWRFAPERTTMDVKIGQRAIAFFTAENLTDKPLTGQASYNIAPDEAARYFTKIQCFCFTQQTLKPHEKVRMPVVFYVDPALLADSDARDVQQITLSYTFHPAPAPAT